MKTIAAIAAVLAAAPAGLAADFATEIKPLFQTYCYKCHGGGKKKGDVVLDTFTSAAEAVKAPKVWEAVLDNLRSGVMPPEESDKQPTVGEREKMMAWVRDTVFAVDPKNPDPGRVTLRRLNRVEYTNTIRDLVGVDFEAGADFPPDDSGYGFDNIGDVLTIPPVLFERYLAAAEKVMSAAILNDHKPRTERLPVNLLKIKGGPEKGNTAISRRVDELDASVEVNLPVAGRYTLALELSGERVGAELTKLDLRFDGTPIPVPPLPADGATAAKHKLAVDVAKAGKHTLTFRVANPLPRPEIRDGKPVTRQVKLRKADFFTPPKPVVAPESQLTLFAPAKGQRNLTVAARLILQAFASRAFRRAVAPIEVERFMFIYGTALKKGGNFEQSVQTALTAVLVSPHFLFRTEFQPEPDSPKAVHNISEWALASRLSYFLWSTMPDAELFKHAQAGTLRANLDAQIRRMLSDPKVDALVDNFAGQWLQTRNLGSVQPARTTFGAWNRELAAAMKKETDTLLEYIIREDRPVTDLLAADYTFVNERLAQHYGIPGVEGDAFVKVTVPANRPGGILGHGSFLTITSNPTRTSPVKRGKYVLENLLGTPPPPPPPDVPDINDPKRKELTGSFRQKMEQHRKDALCNGCHQRMDDIGFALENFDGIGRWRARDGDEEINSAGVLVSGEKFANATELRAVLMKQKRGDFIRCVTEKMLTYALGRGLEYYDRPAIEDIARKVDAGGAKFSTLVLTLVNSVPFQKRRGEGDHREFSGAGKKPAAKQP